jgi:hypothetical protein
MGVTIQQWRAAIGRWSDGRPGKCVAVANAVARKQQQDIHTWFRLLVLVSLLIIGCVELNPGPNDAQVRSRTHFDAVQIGQGIGNHLLHKNLVGEYSGKSAADRPRRSGNERTIIKIGRNE